jgi:hypothetical protein
MVANHPQRTRLIWALFGSALLGGWVIPLYAQPKTGSSQKPNTTVLAKCGVALVMPGYLPAGFQLSSFQQDPCPGRMSGYEALFKGPNSCEFRITGSNGGWGDGGGNLIREWKFRSTLLGPVTLWERENSLDAMMLPEEGRPILAAYPNAGYGFNFGCKARRFSPEAAKRVIEEVVIQR